MATSLRDMLDDSLRYWELRRIYYNLVLVVVVLGWVAVISPETFGGPLLPFVRPLFVLAVIANIFYCAAYIVELPLQYSSYRNLWRRRRWAIWLAGTLLAAVLASYSTAVAIIVISPD